MCLCQYLNIFSYFVVDSFQFESGHYDGKPQNVSNAMEIWACRSEPQMVFEPAIGIDYDYNPLNAYH